MPSEIKQGIRNQIHEIQNEQICKLLFNWKMIRPSKSDGSPAVWRETVSSSEVVIGHRTPTFETMAEASLIIERLVNLGYLVNMWCNEHRDGVLYSCEVIGESTEGIAALRLQRDPLPEVIRRCALICIGPLMHKE